MLNHDSPIPLYYQLEELLRQNIEQGNWPPGTILPSERELCETFAVSRGPVRQALKNLEIAELVRAIQGKGVIVNEKKFRPNPLVNASFFKEIERQGMKPSSIIHKKELISATPDIVHQLRLKPEEPVILIQRLIKGNDLPLALAVTHLPVKLFPDLSELDLTETALYDLIARKYKLPITWVEESFEPVLPGQVETALLGLESVAPTLKVHRIIFSGTVPVDYTTLLIRHDRCRYTLEIPIG